MDFGLQAIHVGGSCAAGLSGATGAGMAHAFINSIIQKML